MCPDLSADSSVSFLPGQRICQYDDLRSFFGWIRDFRNGFSAKYGFSKITRISLSH